MDATLAVAVIGLAILLSAAIFVVAHYRREHRRAQMLRQMASLHWRPYRI
jgi:hypothetical protein